MRFREIMVDEYQDSNGVQDAIFDALTQARQNCFMVGDVKQSIYQFRLADPGIFMKKYEEYTSAEEAAPGQGRKVLLLSAEPAASQSFLQHSAHCGAFSCWMRSCDHILSLV